MSVGRRRRRQRSALEHAVVDPLEQAGERRQIVVGKFWAPMPTVASRRSWTSSRATLVAQRELAATTDFPDAGDAIL